MPLLCRADGRIAVLPTKLLAAEICPPALPSASRPVAASIQVTAPRPLFQLGRLKTRLPLVRFVAVAPATRSLSVALPTRLLPAPTMADAPLAPAPLCQVSAPEAPATFSFRV